MTDPCHISHLPGLYPRIATSSARRGILFALIIIANCQPLGAQEKLLPVFNFERITTANGLPTNEIASKVVRDSQGFIWIGTGDGLVRFDGQSSKIYRNKPGDAGSLSSNKLTMLHFDKRGLLWVGSLATGLSLYIADHDRFVNFLPRDSDSTWLHAKSMVTFFEDKFGNLWCGSLDGEVLLVDLSAAPVGASPDSIARRIRFRTFQGFKNTIWDFCDWDDRTVLVASDNGLFVIDPGTGNRKRPGFPATAGVKLDTVRVASLCWETPQKLWLGTCNQGLYLYDRATGLTSAFHKRPPGNGHRRDDQIMCGVFDKAGRFWVATTSGLDLFNPSSGSYEEYLTSSAIPFGLVTWLSIDSRDIVWVSTAVNGLFFLPPASFRFTRYGLKGVGTTSQSMESISESNDGSVWIRAEGKMIQMQPSSLNILQTIDLYKGAKSKYGGQGGSYVHGSYVDSEGRMWHGSMGSGIYRFELGSGRVLNFRPSTQMVKLPYSTDVCASIAGGTGDSLWIAGYKDGLFQFDTRTNKFTDRSEIFGQRLANVLNVVNDDAGNLWVTDQVFGLLRLNPTTKGIDRFAYKADQSNSLSDDDLVGVYKDPQGRIWVGARMVNLWDAESRGFRHFPNAFFPEARSATPRLSDKRGNLWVSYEWKGLGVLNPTTGTFANYDRTDGLAGANDMAQLHDGRIALVGGGGINLVHPDSLYKPQIPPPFAFTKVIVNDTVEISPQRITGASGLMLPYNRNVIEFEFGAIEPGAPHLIEYSYRLEGLENDWIHTNGRRSVRYPGLNPGGYVFRAKAMNKLGRWPDQEISISLAINPPWWQSRWAYGAYVAILLGSLVAGYRIRIRGIQLKQQAEMEHSQTERIAEVDKLKSRFFANVSHEFRTPLTLILGPAEHAIETTKETSTRQSLRLIRDNAWRLHALVNQLLDFSRVESGAMKLQVSRNDIVRFIRRTAMSFESWAERKDIALEFNSDIETATGFYDEDKLEKILNNLVSNALKFTPEGGKVEVRVFSSPPSPLAKLHEKERGRRGEWVSIAICDNGSGIAPEHLPHIFERFYRVDETHSSEGTGIGLALTKELVDLHHGTIVVESTLGTGTVFTVTLPIDKSAYAPKDMADSPPEVPDRRKSKLGSPSDEIRPNPAVTRSEGKPIVLVVEDNADLRAYVREYLDADYAVREAGNGKEGFDYATDLVPDIVISDVMMPEMDGMELCRALKQDVRTCHIPIILLTAKAGSENKIEGLGTGADDYLTKPFEPKELLARVKNLIAQRRMLRERFGTVHVLRPGEVTVTSIDDAFLAKVKAAIESHMSDEDFSVEELGKEVGMSRSQIHRKVSALTDMPPSDFMRYLRLHRAMDLLRQNAATVAEIAYMVGFSSPAYFTKCFRELFGVTPSEVKPV